MSYVVTLEYKRRNGKRPFTVQVHESQTGFAKQVRIYSKSHRRFTKAFEDADTQKLVYEQDAIIIEEEKE